MLLKFNTTAAKNKTGRVNNILAGDIGATKTNLALIKSDGNNITTIHEAHYKSVDYKNIIELADIFIKNFPLPDVICFGVAGPVLNGHAKLSNLAWEVDSDELSKHFGIKKIKLINDLEATAYGLALLNDKDIMPLNTGSDVAGNAAIIAPGTGLGEAGLYYDGNCYHPFATEGGHSDFAPRNQFDFELYTFLQKKFEHVSWERLICGPGIVNIYEFLRDEKKRDEPNWLKEKFKNDNLPAVISTHVTECKICKETMDWFIQFLAYESANLVLKLKATGGLFIGGGIVPQIISLFQDNQFYSSFCNSGRLNYLLEKVPIKIILNNKTALLGTAYYGSHLIP
ncbi:glucokinase [Ginsengibacter hankyongi]|uniref:Glucokinase n=1 Tax=Ginsengibacter hankyongi TaxID=2607284 RepID=A0A5J5IM90_9BACT|nr:glucokinase [Ginsengibacter hankyongi]KAA9040612.1 glucokinase [Ginsengibacter hankyongi]